MTPPPPPPPPLPPSASQSLPALIAQAIADGGGWLGFEDFMNWALYAPGLGYYSRPGRLFGRMPDQGSDFVTAPELSPLFGRTLAHQVRQALDATGTDEVWEFGAGSGALAAQLLGALGERVRRYTIVDLSGTLRERQHATVTQAVPALADRLHFASHWPERLAAVVVGNEVLDAMPVALLHFDGQQWWERGISLDAQGQLTWADRPTSLTPPADEPLTPGTVTEIHRHAEGFIRSLGTVLKQGAAFFIDYGFPQAEYYHPQRLGGTLMCHHRHRSDDQPLQQIGDKDITAHVNFTGIALAAQEAGMTILGYTSQARFLINCGLVDALADADLRERTNAQKLITEHEMGELFKVIGLAPEPGFDALGFAVGDRTHTL